MGAKAFHGSSYDGHTLKEALEQVDKRRRGRAPKRLWKWMKRRAAVGPWD